jgi:hypothetical protein
MPFGENGRQIDEEARKRLDDLFAGKRPDAEDVVCGQKVDDLRRRLEAERRECGDVDEVTRADIVRRAYAEKYI